MTDLIADFIAKLRNARRLIARGWTRGVYQYRGCYCLEGALFRSGIQNYRFVSPGGGETNHAVWWNDRPERTKAEVLACIDNSIAALEESNQDCSGNE